MVLSRMKPAFPVVMNWTRTPEQTSAEPAVIRAKALELLARREHSRLELRQKLLQRGFPAEPIGLVLEQLAAERLLDEGRYAELYACSRADKGYGPLRIARELRERGVPEEIVTATLAMLEDSWPAKLRDLHHKRFKSHYPADVAGRMQQTRVLRQHGFTLDQIKQLFATD
ncbi:putative Regulatory protein recX [Candidatus Competibacter denitrificans Run_A_D11]|uniref:Regulatory protein RecX n=2 Tax=Candidatus Competibacter TaxID=221279 RepID=W6M4A3_9GAMM|nr:putative Regulatory protein recX [Candidatus Competibacter denitrificans Run_A_D11]